MLQYTATVGAESCTYSYLIVIYCVVHRDVARGVQARDTAAPDGVGLFIWWCDSFCLYFENGFVCALYMYSEFTFLPTTFN